MDRRIRIFLVILENGGGKLKYIIHSEEKLKSFLQCVNYESHLNVNIQVIHAIEMAD